MFQHNPKGFAFEQDSDIWQQAQKRQHSVSMSACEFPVPLCGFLFCDMCIDLFIFNGVHIQLYASNLSHTIQCE